MQSVCMRLSLVLYDAALYGLRLTLSPYVWTKEYTCISFSPELAMSLVLCHFFTWNDTTNKYSHTNIPSVRLETIIKIKSVVLFSWKRQLLHLICHIPEKNIHLKSIVFSNFIKEKIYLTKKRSIWVSNWTEIGKIKKIKMSLPIAHLTRKESFSACHRLHRWLFDFAYRIYSLLATSIYPNLYYILYTNIITYTAKTWVTKKITWFMENVIISMVMDTIIQVRKGKKWENFWIEIKVVIYCC